MTQRLTHRRRLIMAGQVATVIRLTFAAGRISTLFGLEGVLIAALRADLCLRGCRWREAHGAAANIVHIAHGLLGAERPTWYEGQPDFVISPGLLIERTRCKRCHKPLPEGRPKYCSDECCNADHCLITYVRNASAEVAADRAVRAARRAL